jgi:NADPH:quinone reductase-like Zn-dependent oxidoreductase
MIRACKSEGIKTINIVRNEDQIPILKELGGDLVLNSLDSEFWEKLSCGIKEYNATILFDYIGGDLPGKILKAMPESS